jgi:[acyl-carrier-protein] S-malonyltransferase
MQSASELAPSAMVSLVGRPLHVVQELVQSVLELYPDELFIANYLAPDNFTIAGSDAACTLAKVEAKKHGIRLALRLPVSGAFHTRYMRAAEDQFKLALDKALFKPVSTSSICIYSNVTAEPHTDATMRDNLLRQLAAPVHWDSIMSRALSELLSAAPVSSYSVGRAVVLEAGPGTVCASLLKRRKIGDKIDVLSVTV